MGITSCGCSNMTKTNHCQLFTFDFASTKHGLVFLHTFSCQSLCTQVFHVVNSINDTSASQEESTQDQFLDSIGISTRSVENRDSQLSHSSNRNIVCTSTTSCNGTDRYIHLFFFELVRTQHESMRGTTIGFFAGNDIVRVLGEDRKAHLRDFVEGLSAIFIVSVHSRMVLFPTRLKMVHRYLRTRIPTERRCQCCRRFLGKASCRHPAGHSTERGGRRSRMTARTRCKSQ
mmetsp:Transcript_27158/g.44865  ORF Transcript_27158/g.44865 Transcript_27158/m.44865 type:complete len:231 (+) Transcript_27158:2658-3350(+)